MNARYLHELVTIQADRAASATWAAVMTETLARLARCAATSSVFRSRRASPAACETSAAIPSGSTSTPSSTRPRASVSARRPIASRSASVRDSRRSTRHRERSAVTTPKLGFSVVAPMRMTVPASTWGRSASC